MTDVSTNVIRFAKYLSIGLAVISAWWFKDYFAATGEALIALILIAIERFAK